MNHLNKFRLSNKNEWHIKFLGLLHVQQDIAVQKYLILIISISQEEKTRYDIWLLPTVIDLNKRAT